MNYTIHNNDNIEVLKTYPDNHFDSIVTDPPYGISFLGKDWDKHTGEVETWKECMRILKPGGHLIAFSAARTYHRLASNIEDCGFEIRDQLMWIFLSGFPKAQDVGKNIDKRAGKVDENYGTTNVNGTPGGINLSFTEDHIGGSRRCNKCDKDVAYQYSCEDLQCGLKYNPQTEDGKKWAGWKTALKPAHEPIVLARKPMKQSCIDNVIEHGTGALNIDDSRIPYEDENDVPIPHGGRARQHKDSPGWMDKGTGFKAQVDPKINEIGRYPSNIIGELPDYQKYFICPKVSRKERHIGYDTSTIPTDPGGMLDNKQGGIYNGSTKVAEDNKTDVGNNHPTVKPVKLMEYLVKLITPPNGKVLDPFMGSGSTGMAAVALGHHFVGIDLDKDYCKIAAVRIEAWNKPDTTIDQFIQEA